MAMETVAISTSRGFRNSMRVHATRADRAQRFGWRLFPLLLTLFLVGAPRVLAQQVLEVDYETERVVIDDPLHRSLALDMLPSTTSGAFCTWKTWRSWKV